MANCLFAQNVYVRNLSAEKRGTYVIVPIFAGNAGNASARWESYHSRTGNTARKNRRGIISRMRVKIAARGLGGIDD